MAVGPDIAGIGDNCLDVYVEPVRGVAVGGNALNVAVGAAAAGAGAAYLGAVAADPAGRAIVAALAAQGVDVSRVVTLEGATAVTRLRLEPDGDRVFLHEDFGVGAAYAPSDADLAALAACRHVHLAGLTDPLCPAAVLAAAGVPVSLDCSTRALPGPLHDVDVVFASPRDREAGEAVLRAAVDAGAAVAVATLGAAGSLALERGAPGVLACPAAPATVVDTCGAGDSYITAFVLARRDGAPLEDCMRAGARAAAVTVGHVAAWPQELRAVEEVFA